MTSDTLYQKLKLLQNSLEFKLAHELRNYLYKGKEDEAFENSSWILTVLKYFQLYFALKGKMGAVTARTFHMSCVLSGNHWPRFERSAANGVKVEIVWTLSVALQRMSGAGCIRRSVIHGESYLSISLISMTVAQLHSKTSTII